MLPKSQGDVLLSKRKEGVREWEGTGGIVSVKVGLKRLVVINTLLLFRYLKSFLC